MTSNLLALWLSNPKIDFSAYKAIAHWLGCYHMTAVPIAIPSDAVDKEILIELTKIPELNCQDILHKILFLKGIPNGYKTKAVELLRNAHSAQLP